MRASASRFIRSTRALASDCNLPTAVFDLRHQPVDEPVGLELELVDPRLGLSQLGPQRVREGRGAVAIFVRQVRRLLQLCHEGRVSQSGVIPRQIGHRRGGLTLGHDCALGVGHFTVCARWWQMHRQKRKCPVVLALVAAPEPSPATRSLAETLANFCGAAHPPVAAAKV